MFCNRRRTELCPHKRQGLFVRKLTKLSSALAVKHRYPCQHTQGSPFKTHPPEIDRIANWVPSSIRFAEVRLFDDMARPNPI